MFQFGNNRIPMASPTFTYTLCYVMMMIMMILMMVVMINDHDAIDNHDNNDAIDNVGQESNSN